MTLKSSRISGSSTSTNAVEPAWASASPSAKLAPTTGIVRLLGPSLLSRFSAVPTIRSRRSSALPWLKMITASAPASSALRDLLAKPHVPRWIRAMSLSPLKSRPAKSSGVQPLSLARSPVRLMSTGITLPSTVPKPLPVKTPVS